jgi:hypothetical protein
MIDVTKETEKLKRKLENYEDAKAYDQPKPRTPLANLSKDELGHQLGAPPPLQVNTALLKSFHLDPNILNQGQGKDTNETWSNEWRRQLDKLSHTIGAIVEDKEPLKPLAPKAQSLPASTRREIRLWRP